MTLTMNRDELDAFLDQAFPQVAQDFEVIRVAPREIEVRMNVGDSNLRPGGTISGPAMFSLADVSVYLAILAMIGPKALTVTTNASIDFMRKPAAGVDLIARCKLLKLGRALAVGDVLIYSEAMDEPVARASMTYSIPPDR
jgi:uncharacterized protein (TIGR00369 family)